VDEVAEDYVDFSSQLLPIPWRKLVGPTFDIRTFGDGYAYGILERGTCACPSETEWVSLTFLW